MRSVPARIAYAVGVAAAITIAGCYEIPQPECGFTCGPPAATGGEGTCPDGYVCFTSLDNRCHRASPAFTDPCPGDAGIPVDLRPPQLEFESPAPNDINVEILATGLVEVGFDEPVARITDFPNFVVEDANGPIPMDEFGIRDLGQQSDGLFHYEYRTARPFFSDTIHTVRLTEQLTDFSGNAFLGAEWTFRTEVDTTPPMATVQTPSPLTNVFLGSSIDIFFSEPVIGVSNSTFTLTGPSGLVGANITAVQSTFATLDPVGNLLPSTQYTINLTSGITDTAGNPLSFTPVMFTTAADTSSPFVQNTNPTSGSVDVNVLSSISVIFNESVKNVTAATLTLTGPSGAESAVITTGPANAVLNPVHQLEPLTTYSVALSTAILDLANNPLIAFNGSFTTGTDTSPPTVIGRAPGPAAANVPVDVAVVVDFDENITNADATTIQLVAGTAVPATVAFQGAPNFRATLTPSVQLAANTTYTMTLDSTLQDSSGNMLGTPPAASWMFTTGPDMVVPSVASTAPDDNAIDVPLDATISVTFDEPVTGVDDTSFVVMNAGTGTLASSNGGRTWTFTPDAALPANTNITIMLTMAIEDSAGNALVPFAFDFTTLP